ncbi:MAG TPA: sigma-70 family RNA polymerase sigma factor [Thermoguttaceae bacterium]|nr:sigma-70 family RNA polymerase sigma factor [Thermoguttaceae bacterium]
MEGMESGTSPSDLELLRSAREGQWVAFEALVARFEPRVFRLTWRILQQRQDAEDATQQTFISVMEHLDQFREEAAVGTWIFRIATNQALAMLRKRRGRNTVRLDTQANQGDDETPMPHPEFIAQWRDDPAELAERREVKELLGQALSELDEKYRMVFVLRDVEEFSTKETAELLGITESNVKVRLLRARLRLRERLTRALGDESTRLAPDHGHETGNRVT